MPEAAQAGVTPLDIAVKHGFDEVAQAIVSLRAQDLQGVCWTECASPTQSSQVPGGQRACAASVGRYIALCKTSAPPAPSPAKSKPAPRRRSDSVTE